MTTPTTSIPDRDALGIEASIVATSRAAEASRERLVALVLLLQSATRQSSLSQEAIVRELMVDDVSDKVVRKVPAYQGNDSAIRQKFERDKAKIRELGFQIDTVDLDEGGVGYWIDPDSATAPRIDFTESEERVVSLALRFCGFGAAGAFSLFNQGPASDGGLEFTNYYTPVLRALNLRRVVRFDYRSATEKTRVIEPLAIGVFEGASYLVGRVRGTKEFKGYRITRMTSMPVVLEMTFDADDDALSLARAWRPEYAKVLEPIDVVVTTSVNYAELLVRQFPEATRASNDDGTVDVALTFDSPRDALRFLLDAADRVHLRSPKALRRELAEWLSHVNRGNVPDLSGVSFAPSVGNDSLGQTLQLLHAVYLADGGLRISDLAHRFSLAPSMVRRIMDRLVTFEPMAGAYGFPAHVVKECDDWDEEANDDSLYLVETFGRDGNLAPAPLFWRDLFELNIALREAARVYQDPAIDSAIRKIESAVDGFVQVETAHESLLNDLRAAIDNHEQIKIDYTPSEAEHADTRVIEPRDLKILNGHAYVRAYCTTRESWRTFRVDRIGSILAKSRADASRLADPVTNWLTQVGEVGDEVVVVIEPRLRWLFEPLPNAQWRSLDDGRMAVAFRTNDQAFLDHLLLRAGPGAVVATPAHAKAGRALAARITDRL